MKTLTIFLLLTIATADGIAGAADIGAWPTINNVVSSPFGPRLKSSDGNRFDFHRGIDIPGKLGDDICTIDDGVVDGVFNEGSATYPNGGNVIRIKHEGANGSYYSLYLHLNSILVSENQVITKGQKIGTLGQTGATNFDHLHLEILEGTVCSLESQLMGLCSMTATGKDPHQNPLEYIYPSNNTAPSIEVLSEAPLSIRLSVSATELDFNSVKVISKEGVSRALDFNQRAGFDATSTAKLDRQTTAENITIGPGPFSSSTFTSQGTYRIDITFNELDAYRSIVVSDIWGNVKASRQVNLAPIYELLR